MSSHKLNLKMIKQVRLTRCPGEAPGHSKAQPRVEQLHPASTVIDNQGCCNTAYHRNLWCVNDESHYFQQTSTNMILVSVCALFRSKYLGYLGRDAIPGLTSFLLQTFKEWISGIDCSLFMNAYSEPAMAGVLPLCQALLAPADMDASGKQAMHTGTLMPRMLVQPFLFELSSSFWSKPEGQAVVSRRSTPPKPTRMKH